MKRLATVVLFLSPLIVAGACSGSSRTSKLDAAADDSIGGAPGVGGNGGAGEGGDPFNLVGTGGNGGAATICDPGGPDDDQDLDGYTENEGDCNDCDVNVNPNAIEVATEDGFEPQDEDCDDEIDEDDVYVPCDEGIPIDEMDALTFVKAADLCKESSGDGDWGLVSAKWVLPDGSDPPAAQLANFHLGHGIMDDFGPNVDRRHGFNMLGVSSGAARRPNDPGYQSPNGFNKNYTAGHPVGFPKESPSCPGSITGQPHDATGVEFTARTPSNAYGLQFDFDFYTFEWPGFVCSTYNDFFVALLAPFPPNQTDGNISFDSQGNPVSVNNAFIEVCGCPENPPNPCIAGQKSFDCALGDLELIGTGFGLDYEFQDHGATSWLTSTAPVDPNSEITLRWAVYDSGDGVLDSTALVDNFRWIAKPGVQVETIPTPD